MTHPKRVHNISTAHEDFLDQATELLGLSSSSAEQFRRYVREHLAWCESNSLEPPLEREQRDRYRRYLEGRGAVTTERHWRLRATYLNKLPAVLAELDRRDGLRSARRRTSRIDALPAQSRLALAINAILGSAERGYRNSLRADIAVVLEWCAQTGAEPASLSLADIASFDRWLRADGRRSRGPYYAAKRLQRRCGHLDAWWR